MIRVAPMKARETGLAGAKNKPLKELEDE